MWLASQTALCEVPGMTRSTAAVVDLQGGAKNGASYLIANILKTSWPNCVEIGELLQYYMLNTVIDFFV